MADDPANGIIKASFTPAARTLGKALAPAGTEVGTTAVGLIHISTAPFRALIWGYQQIEEKLIPKIQAKIEKLSEQCLIAADPNIVGAALDAAKFHLSSDELTDLFSSLIANAHNSELADIIHPSFTGVIQQLSADDALAVKLIWTHRNNANHQSADNADALPIISVEEYSNVSTFETRIRNLTKVVFLESVQLSKNPLLKNTQIIDNLLRLGIINVIYGSMVVYDDDNNPYKELIAYAENEMHENFIVQQNGRVSIKKGHILITQFGFSFMKTVLR